MKTIGFTGTQQGMTAKQKAEVEAALRYFKIQGATDFRHGDCIGADEQADAIARSMNYNITLHPPTDNSKRAYCEKRGPTTLMPQARYLTRNKHIVQASDIMLACPKEIEEQLRSGTWSTVRYAKRINKLLYIINP